MNPSQFCNIILFSKPAARHTNRDRLLYSTASTSGGRFAPSMRAGFTLVEVLVAMVILLVGIWTLAVSFPKLLGVVATQEKRTEMAQQAQRTLNQLTRHPADLPLGTRGDTFNLGGAGAAGIDATGKPLDPSISDLNITPPNARDDMIEVIGERFTVQAPLAFPYGPYPVHVFRQGLALATNPPVTQVFSERGLPSGFSVDPDGTVNFPGGVDLVEINYDWVDTGGTTHHVYGEFIDVIVTNRVAGESMGNFSQVLSGTVEGIWLFPLTVLPGGVPPPPINEVIEDPSGAMLLFNANSAGDRMRVNYALLTDPDFRNDRRALIMSEEHRIVSFPQTITLVSSHIDEMDLPVDLNADTLYNDTNILAVDLNTGYVYWEGSGLDWLADDALSKGQITVGYSLPAPEIGHDVRFYYVTLDEDLISIQVAPQAYVDEDIAIALTDPSLLYRSYQDVLNGAYTDLLFYPCNAGHTVAVDYKYDDGTTIITVNGEMHTVNTEPGNHYITLNWPNVDEIIAVRGKSLTAIAWWRTPNGRLEKLEINTVR